MERELSQSLKLDRARLRMELRDLEVEIQALQREQQFFRALNFSSELQEVTMVDLLERRRACQERLGQIDQRARPRAGSGTGPLSWVLLSPLLLLLGLQALLGRLARPAGGLS